MAVRAVVENLDDVPESLREEYKPAKVKDTQGKEKEVFALDLTDAESHPSVNALRNSLQRLKDERKRFLDDLKLKDFPAVIAKLKAIPEDFDAEAVATLQARVTELEEELAAAGSNDPKKKDELVRLRTQLEQQNKSLKEAHAVELAEKNKEIAQLESELASVVADEGLTKSLVAAGVEPKYLKATRAMLRGQVKVERENGKPKAVVETDLGTVDLEKYVQDWAGSDEGKEFVKKATGADANGSDSRRTEVNPFDKKTHDLTAQGQILKTDRAKARRLMEQAKMTPEQIQARLAPQ